VVSTRFSHGTDLSSLSIGDFCASRYAAPHDAFLAQISPHRRFLCQLRLVPVLLLSQALLSARACSCSAQSAAAARRPKRERAASHLLVSSYSSGRRGTRKAADPPPQGAYIRTRQIRLHPHGRKGEVVEPPGQCLVAGVGVGVGLPF